MQAPFLDSLPNFILYCNSVSCKRLPTYTHFVSKLFLGRLNTHIFSPQIGKPTTDKRTDKTKVHFSEPMSFIGVTFRTMGEVLLLETENTQRQLLYQGLPSVGDSSQAGTVGHTAQPVGGSAGWRRFFPGAQLA